MALFLVWDLLYRLLENLIKILRPPTVGEEPRFPASLGGILRERGSGVLGPVPHRREEMKDTVSLLAFLPVW